MAKGPFVFDSHALLKFFQKEKGYEKVLHLLEEIRRVTEKEMAELRFQNPDGRPTPNAHPTRTPLPR